jgi:hypothetical protein
MILPNFANHPQGFCHLAWQLPVWQNLPADWQTFANHTKYIQIFDPISPFWKLGVATHIALCGELGLTPQ